jgi:hypothetical protein
LGQRGVQHDIRLAVALDGRDEIVDLPWHGSIDLKEVQNFADRPGRRLT